MVLSPNKMAVRTKRSKKQTSNEKRVSKTLLNGLINKPQNISSLTDIVRLLFQQSATQQRKIDKFMKRTKTIRTSIRKINLALENSDVANSSEVL